MRGAATSERVLDARLSQQRLRERHQEPARRGDPRPRQARRRAAGASSTRCRSTSSGGASRCWSSDGGGRLLVVKGAPEDVLRLVDLATRPEPATREAAGRGGARSASWRCFEQLGEEGFRVLGDRLRATSGPTTPAPPWATRRSWSSPASRSSSIRPRRAPPAPSRRWRRPASTVKMLTGDNERVTRHVCAELGVPIRGVLTGDELTRLCDEALLARASSRSTCSAGSRRSRSSACCWRCKRARPRRRLPRRRHQRRLGAARGRRRHLGRQRRRRGQGGGRPRAARARPGGGPRGRDRGPAHGRERDQVHPDGLELELRQHVQHGGRGAVPALPADAADPGAAQQPALRLLGGRRAARQGRPGAAGAAGALGHAADRALHAGARAGQLALRLPDLRRPALPLPRRRGAVPDRLVRRVAGHPGAGHLRHPHPRRPLAQPARTRRSPPSRSPWSRSAWPCR